SALPQCCPDAPRLALTAIYMQVSMFVRERIAMRRTKEEAAATRKSLLQAALQVFSRKGYAATTLEDIASEAGVTRGAIYWHFGSKAELYNRLVAEMSRRLEQALADVTADGGSPLELLRRQLVRSLEFMEEDEEARAVQELVLFKTAVTPELEAGIEAKR